VCGVQGFQCPSCKEGKNIEGDRELITTDGRIEEVDEFCYLGNVLACKAGLLTYLLNYTHTSFVY